MGDVSGPVEGFELRFQLFHGTTMRVGYQYRVGSVSTLYRCSPVEVYAGVYLPEFLFRLLGYPLFLVVVEYTGLEYVAGNSASLRVRWLMYIMVHGCTLPSLFSSPILSLKSLRASLP